ncbi:MAG: ABC transporter permease [Spirochaetaceae bacterium]|nr:MAG: ABC transporter permease [Spirochaetaceae bacterium]
MSSEQIAAESAYRSRPRFLEILAKNWASFFLVILLVVFSFTGKGFFSLGNLQTIVHLSTVLLLLAAAETFVIISGGIDLSVGMVMGFTAINASKIMQILYKAELPQGICIPVGAAVGLFLCIIPGLISGLLVARYRVPPFIATLGMWGVTLGVQLKISGGYTIPFLPPKLVEIGNGFLIYIWPGRSFRFFRPPSGVEAEQIRELVRVLPNSFLFLFVVLGVAWHLLRNTKFGQHTYAIGGSMDAAVRAGINVRRHLLRVYVLSSFLAGLAGIFNVFQAGLGNFTRFNAMYELFAIAGVIIGGASLMGGKGRVFGSIIGVLIIGVLEIGLLTSGVEPFYRFIAVGIILIVAVVIDHLFPDLF